MPEVRKFISENGSCPIDDWLASLRDRRARARILIRLDRLSLGLEGDWKSVGEGVRELRLSEGKGYRVYDAWDGDAVILLLCGGSKSTQKKDIERAKSYWRCYRG